MFLLSDQAWFRLDGFDASVMEIDRDDGQRFLESLHFTLSKKIGENEPEFADFDMENDDQDLVGVDIEAFRKAHGGVDVGPDGMDQTNESLITNTQSQSLSPSQPSQSQKMEDSSAEKSGEEAKEFIASASFTGQRSGYIFKSGELGVGFYKENAEAATPTESEFP